MNLTKPGRALYGGYTQTVKHMGWKIPRPRWSNLEVSKGTAPM